MDSKQQTNTENASQLKPKPVGLAGVVAITAYLIFFSISLLYSFMKSWPSPTNEASITILVWKFSVSEEVRLIFLVILAGALGSRVHTLRSISWYIGNRTLVWSWLARYILTPFVGSTLSLVFYFVLRGGLFSPTATVDQTSPFGFVGIAAMVGMFTEQAVLKLKDVADTLFTKPKSGADAKPQE